MNTMAKYALMGVGFSAVSMLLGADGVRTAYATPTPSQVEVVNTPTVNATVTNTPSVSVVSMPSTPVNVAGNVGITGNVGIVGTPSVNVASLPGGALNVTGNVGLVAGTTVLADPSQVVPLQAESPGTPQAHGGGPTYGGSTTSGKTALVVQSASDAQQPFGVSIQFAMTADSPTAMGQVLFTVPAHKRAVVERVVVNAGVPAGQQPTIVVFFGAAFPPGAPSTALEASELLVPTLLSSNQFGMDGYLSSAAVRYYIEPGSNVYVLVQWQSAPPSDVAPRGLATVSGYFVDAP